jgi:hypothetical protein
MRDDIIRANRSALPRSGCGRNPAMTVTMTLEQEVAELRAIVAAQSKLLTNLVKFAWDGDYGEKPVILSDSELADLMEEVCDRLPPHLVRAHFPLAPASLKSG